LIDQQIDKVKSPHTRFHSLEIANKGEPLAWTTDGTRLPRMSRCSQIFAHLFEQPKSGTAAQPQSLRKKASILDANLDEARSLKRKMGNDDKGRLDQYLNAVRETEIRTTRADTWLDVPGPEIRKQDRTRTNRDVPLTQADDYLRTVQDLIVLAFQIDAARVVTFSSDLEDQGLAIPELGITQTRHELSHHNGDPEHMEKLTQSDTFAVEQFSYYLSRLTETRDLGGQPAIDTTMALFGSGMAYGNSHGNANLPLVLENFRPSSIVRIRSKNWRMQNRPWKCVKNFEDRWPSSDLF
jgi:hypothetical protein